MLSNTVEVTIVSGAEEKPSAAPGQVVKPVSPPTPSFPRIPLPPIPIIALAAVLVALIVFSRKR